MWQVTVKMQVNNTVELDSHGIKSPTMPHQLGYIFTMCVQIPQLHCLTVIKKCMCRSHSHCLSSSRPTKGLGEFLAVCLFSALLGMSQSPADPLIGNRIKEKVLRFINSVNVKNPQCETFYRRVWTRVTTKCDLRYKMTW